MGRRSADPDSIIPLTPPVFHILLALADRERHGYAIMKEVEARSAGRVQLSTGTLYAAIRRMLEEGLIQESTDRPVPEQDDQRRRYYTLSSLGRRVARAEAERMAQLVEVAGEKQLIGTPAIARLGGQ